MQGDLLEDQQKGASSLTTELQKVREELLHTQTAKTKLELDFNNEKHQFQVTQERVIVLDNQIADLQKEKTNWATQLFEFEKARVQKDNLIVQYEKEKQNKDALINRLENEKSARDNQVLELQVDKETLTSQTTITGDLQREVQKLKLDLNSTKDQVKQRDEVISAAEVRIKTTLEGKVLAEEAKRQLENIIKGHDEHVFKLKMAIETLTQDKNTKELYIKEQDDKVKKMSEELKKLNDSNSDLNLALLKKQELRTSTIEPLEQELPLKQEFKQFLCCWFPVTQSRREYKRDLLTNSDS